MEADIAKVRERTVLLPAAYKAGEQEYRVIDGDGEPARVYVIINRSPVSSRGNYQNDTVWRTIKPGSRNWCKIVRLADEQVQA